MMTDEEKDEFLKEERASAITNAIFEDLRQKARGKNSSKMFLPNQPAYSETMSAIDTIEAIFREKCEEEPERDKLSFKVTPDDAGWPIFPDEYDHSTGKSYIGVYFTALVPCVDLAFTPDECKKILSLLPSNCIVISIGMGKNDTLNLMLHFKKVFTVVYGK